MAQDHWWPVGLSSFWKNEQGKVLRFQSDGSQVASNPKKQGSIGRGHSLIPGELWPESIEPIFNEADTYFPILISYFLSMIDQTPNIGTRPKRIAINSTASKRLPLCISSLIVRSPGFRDGIRDLVYSVNEPFEEPSLRDPLVSANIALAYSRTTEAVRSSAQKLILVGRSTEFLFGDGIATNLGVYGGSSPKGIVALTPNLAFAFLSPTTTLSAGEWIAELPPDWVHSANEATQIYSKDCVFSRSGSFKLSDYFKCGERLAFDYHRIPVLDYLQAQLSDVSS